MHWFIFVARIRQLVVPSSSSSNWSSNSSGNRSDNTNNNEK